MSTIRRERQIPLVLHVLPLDLVRGGQAQVRALCDQLDEPRQRHRTLTLFISDEGVLRPDFSLGVRPGRLRSLGFHPLAYSRLRRTLQRLRPAIVIAHGSESLKYAAFASPSRVPRIYHRIGLSGPKLKRPVNRSLYRATVRRADAIVAVSDNVLQDLHRVLRRPPKRELVIPNARDSNAFSPGADRPRAATTPRLLFVGHLSESKRPAMFLDIVAQLTQQNLAVCGVMVGDGPLLSSLRARAGAIGVRMLGRRGDVAQLMKEGDLFVFTSGANSEGLPGVLIEAGLTGLPIVTTDAPGARDVVLDGETGFVVGVDDLDGMISKLRRLISDPSLRAKMGDAARSHCVATFSIEASAMKWRNLIDELIDASSSIR